MKGAAKTRLPPTPSTTLRTPVAGIQPNPGMKAKQQVGSPSKPVVRYHNIDDDPSEFIVTPSFGGGQRTSRMASSKRVVDPQLHTRTGSDSPLLVHQHYEPSSSITRPPRSKSPPTITQPHRTDSPSALLRIPIHVDRSDSIGALKYKKLGHFPSTNPSSIPTKSPSLQQAGKVENFSEEWMKKKNAALERRKNKLRKDELARKVVDHWKWFARDGLGAIKARNYRNRILIFKTFQHWKKRKEDRDTIWKREFILQTRQKFSMMQQYFHKWVNSLEEWKQKEDMLTDKAFGFLQLGLEKKAMKSLKLHVNICKKKKEDYQVAINFSNTRILRNVFELIRECKCFILLMTIICLVKIINDQKVAADNSYRCNIMKKAIKGLQLNVIGEEQEREIFARNHYEHNLMLKGLSQLAINANVSKDKRKTREELNSKSDEFYRSKHLKVVFQALVDYCHARKEKQVKCLLADKYHKKISSSQILRKWTDVLNRKLYISRMEVSICKVVY